MSTTVIIYVANLSYASTSGDLSITFSKLNKYKYPLKNYGNNTFKAGSKNTFTSIPIPNIEIAKGPFTLTLSKLWWGYDDVAISRIQILYNGILVTDTMNNPNFKSPFWLEKNPYTYTPPIDCAVSNWSPWSSCSAPCGLGDQTQTRSIITNTTTLTDAGADVIWSKPLAEKELLKQKLARLCKNIFISTL